MSKIKRSLALIVLTSSALTLNSCETLPEENRGSLTGTLTGALVGGIITAATGDWSYLAAGTVGGALVGNEYDKTQMGKRIDKIEEDANTLIINIENSNGSFTSVPLIRRGSHYIGPRGEMYPNIPSKEQLKMAYGF